VIRRANPQFARTIVRNTLVSGASEWRTPQERLAHHLVREDKSRVGALLRSMLDSLAHEDPQYRARKQRLRDH
jgi:hypothetical protein